VGGYVTSKGIGALAGKLAGSGASDRMIAGMSEAGRAAAAPAATTGQPLLDALMRGAGYDELAALSAAKGAGKAAAPVAQASASGASALEAELMAREQLAKPINWRTTDVTPINRPGKGIHFGEESTPGLLKLLQDAQLAKDATLADKILTAIRQRSHITGKVGKL
jgi:hypothetical protein